MSTPPGPPPDELDLRASDAERRRTTDRLADALASGELTADEHAERMEQALTARTRRELAALTSDLREPLPDRAQLMTERSAGRRRELLEDWRSWLAAAVVLNAIWLISRLVSDHPAWGGWGAYWPIWPLGIWGAFLLVRSVMPGDDD